MWGSLIQLAGMGYQSEMNGRATTRSMEKARAARAAEKQYGKYAQKDEDESTAYLRGLSFARLRNQAQLATDLSGQPMLDAAAAGESEYGSRLADSLGRAEPVIGRGTSGINRGTPLARAWGARAMGKYAPRLGSQARLVTLAGRRQGVDRFRQDEMNGLAEASITLDRKTNERMRRSALLDAYRRRKLSEIMRKYGVDTGEGEMRAQGALVAGLANVAGSGVNSYMANRPASNPTWV